MLISPSHPDPFVFGLVVVFTSHESELIMSVVREYEPDFWVDDSDDTWRVVDALTDATGMDISEVADTYGLGFVEEHGLHTAFMVEQILDPTVNLEWMIAR
jgi:hypothetical protein